MSLQRLAVFSGPVALTVFLFHKSGRETSRLHEERMKDLRELRELHGVPKDATREEEVKVHYIPEWNEIKDIMLSNYMSNGLACGGLATLTGMSCGSRFMSCVGVGLAVGSTAAALIARRIYAS